MIIIIRSETKCLKQDNSLWKANISICLQSEEFTQIFQLAETSVQYFSSSLSPVKHLLRNLIGTSLPDSFYAIYNSHSMVIKLLLVLMLTEIWFTSALLQPSYEEHVNTHMLKFLHYKQGFYNHSQCDHIHSIMLTISYK